MMVPLSQSMKRLTVVWFLGAGVVCLIVLLQTLMGHYGDKSRDAWAWLLPAVLPTLTLIATVWRVETRGTVKSGVVDSFGFWLALGLSVTYLSVIALTTLLQPMLAASPQGYLDIMHGSSFFIGPFQAVVSASLGSFFVKKEAGPAPEPGAHSPA
jgi:hypothetical protein